VLFLIVWYADRGTLAALGSVATELLRVTTPLLYEEIEVTTIKQLELLFRARKPIKVSRSLYQDACGGVTSCHSRPM
jgi:hypothetical protein